jgi:predicted membrane-bound spermidine synthase
MQRNLSLYFLSFLEGASVMAAELLGAKMLAPFFGASLYVWSAVLAVTLGGLALGYFAGGIFSQRKNVERNLYCILLASAFFLMLMPMLAKEIMIHTTSFSLIASILVSTLTFLLPPVFFMGMVSPMIVQCIASNDTSGKISGTVFAISTVGGIVSTFLLGFYLIPNFGLKNPAIVMGTLLGIIPFIKLISKKNFSSLIFPLAAFLSFNSAKSPIENSEIKILYSSEGLLGQIVVADYASRSEASRILFVNRSPQTIVTTKDGKKSFFDYVKIAGEISKKISAGDKALLLGLGGGSIANELLKDGYSVDAVDLDERMEFVAKRFFDLNEKANIIIDDGRHYLNQRDTTQKYSLIVIDAFVGESNPHHLFTQETFFEMKKLLTSDGIIMINGNGFWNGKAGKGMRSIAATLKSSGFSVNVIPTRKEEEYRNLEFIAWQSSDPVLTMSGLTVSVDDAILLTDEKPQLEILNAEANKRWREQCINYFLSGYFSKKDNLIFN